MSRAKKAKNPRGSAGSRRLDVAALTVSLIALVISSATGIRSVVISDRASSPQVLTSTGFLRSETWGPETLYCEDSISIINVGGAAVALTGVAVSVTIGNEQGTVFVPGLGGPNEGGELLSPTSDFWFVTAWTPNPGPFVVEPNGGVLALTGLTSEIENLADGRYLFGFPEGDAAEKVWIEYELQFDRHDPISIAPRVCTWVSPVTPS